MTQTKLVKHMYYYELLSIGMLLNIIRLEQNSDSGTSRRSGFGEKESKIIVFNENGDVRNIRASVSLGPCL